MAKTQKNISKLSLYSKLLLSENQNLNCGLEVKVDFIGTKYPNFLTKSSMFNIKFLEIFEEKNVCKYKVWVPCVRHYNSNYNPDLYFLNPLFEGQKCLLKGLSFWLDVRKVLTSGFNQEPVMMARVWYSFPKDWKQFYECGEKITQYKCTAIVLCSNRRGDSTFNIFQ